MATGISGFDLALSTPGIAHPDNNSHHDFNSSSPFSNFHRGSWTHCFINHDAIINFYLFLAKETIFKKGLLNNLEMLQLTAICRFVQFAGLGNSVCMKHFESLEIVDVLKRQQTAVDSHTIKLDVKNVRLFNRVSTAGEILTMYNISTEMQQQLFS